MAPGSRTTFVKRQKERARQEKARAKAERKQQKKSDGTAGDNIEFGQNELYLPDEQESDDSEE